MSPLVLNQEQMDQFVADGFCMLRDAFSAEAAERVCQTVLLRLRAKGIDPEVPASLPQSVTLEERLRSPEVLDCFNHRVAGAIVDLVGADQWRGLRDWGLWSVNFGTAEYAGDPVPDYGWHIDGNWFVHTIDSNKQGLVVLGLFTDVGIHDGPTIVAVGSHIRTAHALARHPDGITHRHLFREILASPLDRFTPMTGSAGDVALLHPFLFHTRGIKALGPPRIVSNAEAPLRRQLRIGGHEADLSVLERSINLALTSDLPQPVAPRSCYW